MRQCGLVKRAASQVITKTHAIDHIFSDRYRHIASCCRRRYNLNAPAIGKCSAKQRMLTAYPLMAQACDLPRQLPKPSCVQIGHLDPFDTAAKGFHPAFAGTVNIDVCYIGALQNGQQRCQPDVEIAALNGARLRVFVKIRHQKQFGLLQGFGCCRHRAITERAVYG